MMVIDTSVLIAVLKGEDDAVALTQCMAAAPTRYISAGSMLECGIVIGAFYGDLGLEAMRELASYLQLKTVPFDANQSRAGYEAFRRYGRGSKHPAKLNFGDCFAYALARTRNLPLLFKGDDFIHTDIVPALKPV
jgi:ribonuclease VapC